MLRLLFCGLPNIVTQCRLPMIGKIAMLWVCIIQCATATPNIVFILADDLGIMDIAAYAARFSGKSISDVYYETPNLDRLVGNGLVFSQAYANQLCTPTRAAILTGQYPSRMGITTATPPHTKTFFNQGLPVPKGVNQHDAYAHQDAISLPQAWINAYSNTALDPAIPSLPQVLKSHEAFFIGKWHLGSHGVKGYQPQDHGFNILNYYDAGASVYFDWQKKWEPAKTLFPAMPQQEVCVGNAGGAPYADYLIDDTAVRVERFLHARAQADHEKPFFLYLNHFAVHTPLQAPRATVSAFESKPQRGTLGHQHPSYAAMLKHLDQAVGRVMQALEATGLDETTMLIFTSDNGGVEYTQPAATDNAPFRGGKACLYEGGVRVPLIVYWKGHFSGGHWIHQPVNCIDFLPTLADITNNPVPEKVDGMSLVPFLERKDTPLVERTFIWHYPFNVIVQHPNDGLPLTPHSAIRQGDYKLIWDWHGRLELYDVQNDPFESHDLAALENDRTDALFFALRSWLDQNVEPRYFPQLNPNYESGSDTPRSQFINRSL